MEDTLHGLYTSGQYSEHSAFIVIDGLDEVPQEALINFIDLLEKLAKSQLITVPRVHFIVFGRPEIIDLIGSRRRQKFIHIGQRGHDDIVQYIKEKLRMIHVLRLTKPKAQAEKLGRQIKERIIEKANGIFFWAKA